ncbi:MAG TPA: hypothetical protein VHB77_00240, partial [Planctomycetaceae bacterium]|nr:hypothetical protein [Planctomycetaceae bacterium]
AVTVGAEQQSLAPPVEMHLGRLLVGGRHFYPRIVSYHGEGLDDLATMRFNTVWVPDFKNAELLKDLAARGLWATATPPVAVSETGTVLDAETSSLATFGPECDPILFWMLGSGITPREKDRLVSWREQLLSADRRLHRPLLGEVTGLERVYSQMLNMFGMSRRVDQTSLEYPVYRDWLVERQKQSKPGSFFWTWIQTEPSDDVVTSRRTARKILPVIEPEQIRLQTYAAWSAGCRGIGYWTTTSLDDDRPGGRERKLIIAQLNLEHDLLEEWLATGTLWGQVPFTPPASAAPPPRTNSSAPRGAGNVGMGMTHRPGQLLGTPPPPKPLINKPAKVPEPTGTLETCILKTDFGTLLLPAWYGHHAQFCPGPLAGTNVRIRVEGIEASAAAWEVSTTNIQSLEHQRVAGGMELILPKFDMTSIIVVSSDPTLKERFRRRIERMAPISAQLAVQLAEAKFERVTRVDRELHSLGVGQSNSAVLLGAAQSLIEQARASLMAHEYHRARQVAGEASQMLRRLQRACWDEATHSLSSPASSPHTICFQTLPDHWRLVTRFGQNTASSDSNLLRSGDFEDADTVLAENWGHAQQQIPGVRAGAELYPLPHRGNYCLRLVAAQAAGEDAPLHFDGWPVTVTTSPVMVRSGQIVHISGWVKVVSPIGGGADGMLIYDSIGGSENGLRYRVASDWQRFDLIREVQETGELTLKMALGGLGEVQFDDLRIIAQTPVATETAGGDSKIKPAGGLSKGFDMLPKIPSILPKRSKPADE